MFCEQCGAKNQDQTKFCTSCGAKMRTEYDSNISSTEGSNPATQKTGTPVMVEQQQEAKDHFGYTEESTKRKSGLSKLIAGAVLVVAVGALVYGGFNILKGSNKKTVVRDRSNFPILYVKSSQLMVRGNGKDSSYVAANGDRFYYGDVLLTRDGKTMFFADDASSNGYRLYYRKVDEETPKGKDADSKGIRIATGVTAFNIQKDGKFVVYQKEDRLYYSNLKEEKSISSDVVSFNISRDESKVVFSKSDGSLYIWGPGKKDNIEKVDSEISYRITPRGEYENIYYIKDYCLYQKQYGKDREKLVNDIESAVMVGNQIYVVKIDEDSFDDYTPTYILYKLVDGELSKVADELLNGYLTSSIDEYGGSQINSNAVVFRKLSYTGEQELYILQGDNPPFKASNIDLDDIGLYGFSHDGKYFYVIEDLRSSRDEGELVRYTVGSDSLKDRERIYDVVSNFILCDKDIIITSSSNNGMTLGLYTGGKYKEISDEAGYFYRYIDGILFYLDDYNSNRNTGTLMKYKDGKSEKIDIDVYSIDVRSDNYVVYIKDFSTKRNYGDLYYKKGRGKAVKVDTDVSYIVTIY